VSPELRDQVEVALAELARLLAVHRPLLDECAERKPNHIEVSALGAALHAFYTGAESLLRRIAVEAGDIPLHGDAWHQALLLSMSGPTALRPAVISEETRVLLRPYLQFRHVFRQAYTSHLDWARMSPLILRWEEAFAAFARDVHTFVGPLGE